MKEFQFIKSLKIWWSMANIVIISFEENYQKIMQFDIPLHFFLHHFFFFLLKHLAISRTTFQSLEKKWPHLTYLKKIDVSEN